MATLSADKLTKVSTEAAANFVESFYAALNNSRETIASYYMPATTMTDGKSLPVILFNSNVIEGPTAMQTLFKEKMPESQYEVQDYDCHVLNSHYVPQDAEGPSQETAKNMIILITINGQVRYGDVKSTLNSQKGFSESIVLAPNPAAVGNERGKPVKEWLIQSQNFRLVI